MDSETDIGTTVKLFFPKSTEAALEETHLSSSKGAAALRYINETVLLVEDDEQVLHMAVGSLEDLRHVVIAAKIAREALTYLEGNDRIDEARRLQPELTILLTSGNVVAQAEILDSDLRVLTKPYKRDELAHQLRLVRGEPDRWRRR